MEVSFLPRPWAASKATWAMRRISLDAVDHGIDGDRLAVFLMAALGLAEVEAAGELADAEDIEAAGDDRLLDRGGVGELGEADRGAEIGEE